MKVSSRCRFCWGLFTDGCQLVERMWVSGSWWVKKRMFGWIDEWVNRCDMPETVTWQAPLGVFSLRRSWGPCVEQPEVDQQAQSYGPPKDPVMCKSYSSSAAQPESSLRVPRGDARGDPGGGWRLRVRAHGRKAQTWPNPIATQKVYSAQPTQLSLLWVSTEILLSFRCILILLCFIG